MRGISCLADSLLVSQEGLLHEVSFDGKVNMFKILKIPTIELSV
jgi:hypothetical protein